MFESIYEFLPKANHQVCDISLLLTGRLSAVCLED